MNNLNKWVVGVVVLIVVFIGFSYFGGSEPAEGDSIKIGAILPMTGIGANYGEHQFNAMKLAVNEINSKGGVLGRPLEIILEDDATDPKKTVSSFVKLTSIDKAPVIVGVVWDFLANAVMPLTKDNAAVIISPSAAPDTLGETTDSFFTTFPPINVHQPVIEEYLEEQEGNNIAIVYINNSWGIAHRDTYRKAIENTNKTNVVEIKLPKFDGNDIQGEMTRLLTFSPDVILTAVNIIDPKLIIEKNKELELNAKIFGHDNIIASYLVQGTKKDALTGVVVYRLALPDEKFTKKYRDLYSTEPISEADKAYDAVYVIAKAIEISKDPSADGIKSGLKQIKNYKGVSGPIDYTEGNWPTKDTARLEIFDGENFIPYLD